MEALALEELVQFGDTADWRLMKAEEFPNDRRNAEAAELLGKLAEGLPDLNGSKLHERISCLIEKLGEQDPFLMHDEVGQMLRSVGFHWFPETTEEALSEIADKLESLLEGLAESLVE